MANVASQAEVCEARLMLSGQGSGSGCGGGSGSGSGGGTGSGSGGGPGPMPVITEGWIEIELNYGNSFNVGPAPTSVDGDTFNYVTGVPFTYNYYVEPETTHVQELRVWSADGSVDISFTVNPGFGYGSSASVPALEGGVTVFAEFVDPETGPWPKRTNRKILLRLL